MPFGFNTICMSVTPEVLSLSLPDLSTKLQTHLSDFLYDTFTWISDGNHKSSMAKTQIWDSLQICSYYSLTYIGNLH